jgi:SAM-dependent methyltransferase
MAPELPWYVTLYERDYHDLLAPGGLRSPVDSEAYDRQTDEEAAFVATALELSAGASVLDLCCGWGRHTVRLAQRGYAMTGLDLSPYHLDLARSAATRASVDVDWIESDMRTIPRPDGSFDGVISMFTSFGYLDDAENQRVLDDVARVLVPGGKLLLDVLNRDGLAGSFRERYWTRGEDEVIVLEQHGWDATNGRLEVDWTVIDREGVRRAHHYAPRVYTLQELEVLLALAGMPVRAAFGGFDGRPLARDSRRLIVLAQKS